MAWRVTLIVFTCVAGVAVGIYVAGGGYQAVRLLARTAPLEPSPPASQLGRMVARLGGLLRGWLALMVAGVVGAAVSDFDHDRHAGPVEMAQLLLVVAGAIALWWSLSVAVTVWRIAHQPRTRLARAYGPFEVAMSCVMIGIVAMYGLAEAGQGIGWLAGQ